ncbi:hypothetical protein AUEXF2481DRAFT_645458 [Aureobasidium subglaciale EXF-2481]|uniref:Uncharacterized protein n=1 Tax=Aureobasidium subglaciale (strain EXF-2481) TaxID=1043005 RepID=A0A074ZD29_AURSE|nr:uncharacterized protein AUEXF2481DRAFT_645458 [Aureobasidium subglaciale EXF-2481]KEQ96571.1 hypothetical protein AUEXF2481DRAFT_645458 [Aureobasidium subglaciale EXF-2481]
MIDRQCYQALMSQLRPIRTCCLGAYLAMALSVSGCCSSWICRSILLPYLWRSSVLFCVTMNDVEHKTKVREALDSYSFLVAIKVSHVVAQDHAMDFYDYKLYPPLPTMRHFEEII